MPYNTPDADHFSLPLEVRTLEKVSDEWRMKAVAFGAHSNDPGVRHRTETFLTDNGNPP